MTIMEDIRDKLSDAASKLHIGGDSQPAAAADGPVGE